MEGDGEDGKPLYMDSDGNSYRERAMEELMK